MKRYIRPRKTHLDFSVLSQNKIIESRRMNKEKAQDIVKQAINEADQGIKVKQFDPGGNPTQIQYTDSDGAVKMIDVNKPPREIGDVVQSGLWASDPQVKFDQLVGRSVILMDARKLQGDMGDYYILRMCDRQTGKVFTSACGGVVVVKKVDQVLDKKALPVSFQITKTKDYFDLV